MSQPPNRPRPRAHPWTEIEIEPYLTELQETRDAEIRGRLMQFGYTEEEFTRLHREVDRECQDRIRSRYGRVDYPARDGDRGVPVNRRDRIRQTLLHWREQGHAELAGWVWTWWNASLMHIIGDTIGYRNGMWEFNEGDPKAGPEYIDRMIDQFIYLGGINDLSLAHWNYSDDSVLYLATLRAIPPDGSMPTEEITYETLVTRTRDQYLEVVPDLESRHPGETTMRSLATQRVIAWDGLPHNRQAIGAGALMRVAPLWLMARPADIVNDSLDIPYFRLALDNSRLTHPSAMSVYGCYSLLHLIRMAVTGVPVNLWPSKLVEILRAVPDFTQFTEEERVGYGIDQLGMTSEMMQDLKLSQFAYLGQWIKYLDLVFVGDQLNPDMPYLHSARQRYGYLADNFSKRCGVPGGCADDCLIMAYDSVLRSGGNLERLLVYACLHPGDSDTVGCLAFHLFSLVHGGPRLDVQTEAWKQETTAIYPLEELFSERLYLWIDSLYYGLYLHYYYALLPKYDRNLGFGKLEKATHLWSSGELSHMDGGDQDPDRRRRDPVVRD